MCSTEESTEMSFSQKDSTEVPSCRLRKKSVCKNDENDNISGESFEMVEECKPDEKVAPGLLASLWASAPAIPSIQPLDCVQGAPGMLASLWRSTPSPSFQNVAHMVHGTLRLQNILQSMVPGTNPCAEEVDEADMDTVNEDTPLKLVKKVENKKQS
jgi:hypothetical protein